MAQLLTAPTIIVSLHKAAREEIQHSTNKNFVYNLNFCYLKFRPRIPCENREGFLHVNKKMQKIDSVPRLPPIHRVLGHVSA